METRVVDNPEKHRFELVADGEVAGFVTYKRDATTLSLNHTEVDRPFEGQGLGSVLIRDALDAARASGASVLPFCPFVRRYLQRHPEYLDLVPPAERARFELPAQ
jgi:predicted GNAT family acetyltransferase